MEAEEDADAEAQSTTSYGGEGESAAPMDSNGSEFPASEKSDEPIALLQLRDGSMYGLTDYWVQNGVLHYQTTYGGQNSIALDRIDIPKTEQLNAQRGFVLDLEARKH